MFRTAEHPIRRSRPGVAAPAATVVFAALISVFTLGACSSDEESVGVAATPPSAPNSLTATSGDRLVNLAWEPASNAEEEGLEPTHYSIFRATAPDTEIFPVTTNEDDTGGGPELTPEEQMLEVELARVEATETTFADLTALNYVANYYRVIAVNDGGLSPPSNEVLALPKDFSTQIEKAGAPESTESERFGHAVLIGDGFALAGNFTTGESSVYVLEREDDGRWGHVETLRGSETRTTGDIFGASLAMDGNNLVIGKPNFRESDDAGVIGEAAYVFTRQSDGSWIETAILRATEGQVGDHFGLSVAIDGDLIVVGAELKDGGEDSPAANAGAAYVFRRQTDETWLQSAVLRASDGSENDAFGGAVAVSGDVIVVGAPGEDGGSDDPEPDAGTTYVFERQSDGGWEETMILTPETPTTLDHFGASIAMDGDVVMIGAPGDQGPRDLLLGAGAVFVFLRIAADRWTETAVLSASDGGIGENFGASIAIGADFTVIGATAGNDFSESDPSRVNAGAAYLFSRDTDGVWSELSIFRPGDGQLDDNFGVSVGIFGNEIVVGADLEDGGTDDPNPSAGVIYFY